MLRSLVAWRYAIVSLILLLTQSKPVSAQPAITHTWSNFSVTGGTLWTNNLAWLNGVAPPTNDINNVLGFGTSTLSNQSAANGYRATYAFSFDVNALVFNGFGAPLPAPNVSPPAPSDTTQTGLTGFDTASTIRFNTTGAGVLPSIWQTATGAALIQNGNATNGMTLAGGATGTTLEFLGGGIGHIRLNANIVQTGAGNSGLRVGLTGTRHNNTGVVLRLSPAGNNTFANGVELVAGNLQVASASSLGTGPLTVNTLAGQTSSLQFDLYSTTTLSLQNNINLLSNLDITGITNVPSPNFVANFEGVISGPGGLFIRTTNGTLPYALTSANTFTGPIVVQPVGNTVSTISLGTNTQSTGTATGVSSFVAYSNSSITFNNQAGVATRSSGSANLTLNRANFNFNGNANANSSESFNTLTVNGTGSLTVLGASNTANEQTITFNNLNRGFDGRGTLSITATNLGSGTGNGESVLVFTNNPGGAIGGIDAGTTRPIFPYILANQGNSTVAVPGTLINNLIRWDSATQRLAPLQPNEYAANLYLQGTNGPFQEPLNNLRYQSTAAEPVASSLVGIDTNATANSLVLSQRGVGTNPVGVSVSGSGTLSLFSGAILSTINDGNQLPTIPQTINLGSINFGPNTGYITTLANLVVNSPIQGTNGFVKSGFGSLWLTQPNPISGTITHNSGLLNFSNDDQLGAAGASITLNSGLTGSLALNPFNLYSPMTNANEPLNRPITVGPAGSSLSVILANQSLIHNGTITGPAGSQIQKAGAGVLVLNGNNSGYAGNWSVVAGTLATSSSNALGSANSTLILSGGTFQPTSSFTMNQDILVTAGSLILTNPGVSLTVSGNFSSQVEPPFIIKEGAGDLIFTNENTFLGGFQVGTATVAVRGLNTAATTNSGRLILNGVNGSLPQLRSLLVLGGGEVILDNTVAINENRLPTVTVGTGGGLVTLRGNAGASVSEVIGSLSFGASTSAPFGGIYTAEQPDSGGNNLVTSLNFRQIAGGAGVFGTVQFRGTNLGAATGDRGEFISGTLPGQVNGLIPNAVGTIGTTGDPTTFLTTQTIVNVNPNLDQFRIVPFTSYTAGTGSLGAGGATLTYDITGATSFTGTSASNAMRVNGGSTIDLGGGTHTLSASHVLTVGTGTNEINNGNLNFGSGIVRLTVGTGSDLNLGAVVQGAGVGLVKFGDGTLTLNTPATFTGTNAAGGWAIADGVIRYGVANAIPTNARVLINSGARLELNGTNSTLAWVSSFGDVDLGTNGTLTLSSTTNPTVAFGGAFLGTGTIIKTNTNIFTAAGNSSSFNGNVRVLAGTLNLASQTGVGTGPIQLGDGTGTLDATLTLATTVKNFSNNVTVPSGTNTAVFALNSLAGIKEISGNIAINRANTSATAGGITATNIGVRFSGNFGNGNGATTLTGTISGIGGIHIFGGNWNFPNANTYQGPTFFDTTQATAFGVGNNNAFSTGELVISSFGGNFRADGGTRTLANNLRLSGTGAYFGVTGNNPFIFSGDINIESAASPLAAVFAITNRADTTFNGVISNGPAGISKIGPGTLILGGANTYTGPTTISAGILRLTNTGVLPGTVTIQRGAILQGTGTVNGLVNMSTGAILAPGGSPGTLTLGGGLNTSTQSILSFGIFDGSTPAAPNTGGSSDLANLPNPNFNNFLNFTGGSVTIDPTTIIRVNGTGVSFTLNSPYSYLVAQGAGDQSGLNITNPNQFATLGFVADPSGFSLTGNATGQIFLQFTPVPEPVTILATSAGILALGALARRRRTQRLNLAA